MNNVRLGARDYIGPAVLAVLDHQSHEEPKQAGQKRREEGVSRDEDQHTWAFIISERECVKGAMRSLINVQGIVTHTLKKKKRKEKKRKEMI